MGRNGTGVKAASQTSIEITFIYRGKRCRERIKLKPTASNLIKAERHRHAILHAIENDLFDYETTFPDSKNIIKFNSSGDLTVKKHLNSWLVEKKPTISSSTFTGYKKTINILSNEFGETLLYELSRKDVLTWVKTLNCSNKRLSNLLSPLRCALADAKLDGIIKDNPLENWSYKRKERPNKSPIDPFNAEEQKMILTELNGQAKNLIQFAFWTGLRTSELIALEWDDINLNRKSVSIIKALTQSATEAEAPKTKPGKREVKLLRPAINALENQRKYISKKYQNIFLDPKTNIPWTGDQSIRKTLWTPALKRANVRYRKPYQTRHTYASMMLSAEEPLAWVSNQLGHASVYFTAQTYATWIPDSQPDIGNKAVKKFAYND